MESCTKIKPGDRIFAIDYYLWTDGESFDIKDCIKPATVIEVRLCETFQRTKLIEYWLTFIFDHQGMARSYFLEQLIKEGT